MDLSKPLFHIRHAEPADAAAIVRLIQELAESLGEQSPNTHGYAQIHLSFPDRGLLLEENAGAVIGLLSNAIRPDLDHTAPSALIEELMVSSVLPRPRFDR